MDSNQATAMTAVATNTPPQIDYRLMDVLNPRVEDVRIDFIASMLARMPWGVGASGRFYSLAQHQVEVARRIHNQQWRLLALLAGASAAYLGDLRRIRPFCPQVAEIQERVQAAIHHSLGLPAELPDGLAGAIGRVEQELAPIEGQVLEGEDDRLPTPYRIKPLPPVRAQSSFLSYFHMLRAGQALLEETNR